jgi:hypothetical protein
MELRPILRRTSYNILLNIWHYNVIIHTKLLQYSKKYPIASLSTKNPTRSAPEGWGGGNPKILIENSSTKRLHITDTTVPLLYGWVRLYRGAMTDIPSLLVLQWFEVVRVKSLLSHYPASKGGFLRQSYKTDAPLPLSRTNSFNFVTWKSNAKK